MLAGVFVAYFSILSTPFIQLSRNGYGLTFDESSSVDAGRLVQPFSKHPSPSETGKSERFGLALAFVRFVFIVPGIGTEL